MMEFSKRSVTNTLNSQIKLNIQILNSNSVFFKQMKEVITEFYAIVWNEQRLHKAEIMCYWNSLLCALYDKCKNFLSCIQLWNNKNKALWTSENKLSLNRPIEIFL